MAYVIIGNSAAGIAAAEGIRQQDKSKSIAIISDEPHAAYSRCLTSYYLGGEVTEAGMQLRQDGFYTNMGIDLRAGQKVTCIDPDSKKVVMEGGMKIAYDKLLIAAGASPKVPDLPGLSSSGIFTLRTLADAKRIAQAADKGNKAVILGGGLVSLKTAAALRHRGTDVTVLVSSNRVMSRTLGETAAKMVEEQLGDLGVTVITRSSVKAVEADASGNVSGVKLENGELFPADFVVVGKGVRPNTGILEQAGLVTAAGQPVSVNRYQETRLEGVYAAGDVALTYDILEERYVYNAIWPNAVEQGKIAGANMAGAAKVYGGSISMNAAVFGGMSIIAAGIGQPQQSGFRVFEERNSKQRSYQQLVVAENRLAGYTLIGDTARAGLYTALIKSRQVFKSVDKLVHCCNRSYVTLSSYG
ncbi:FAD-dependent oxidoreductase [Metallumcola ferriviriculae]|uniref:FAD-dependent oxidoreductase n=1 Tax=Metallumcola ferriviriculae TaxID=3039180 RepID=A0AAU0UN11_9FIRM|nr:FAD-dependent oxidoreductase [Desulfitibacteraceae bacterium MK1]